MDINQKEIPAAVPANNSRASSETSNESVSSVGIQSLSLGDDKGAGSANENNASGSVKKAFQEFWSTQPVPQAHSKDITPSSVSGYISPPKDDIGQPTSLPEGLQWMEVNIDDEQEIRRLFDFLFENYAEDDAGKTRFAYSIEFLQWALKPPGFRRDLHLGLVDSATNEFIGFISGVPVDMSIHGQDIRMQEVNFLCVKKSHRSKRLAPFLIKELARRWNGASVYTGATLVHGPTGSGRYWIRVLQFQRLVDVGYITLSEAPAAKPSSDAPEPAEAQPSQPSSLPETPQAPSEPVEQTPPALPSDDSSASQEAPAAPEAPEAAAEEPEQVSYTPRVVNLRPLEASDIPSTWKLVTSSLSKFKIHPVFKTEEDFAHWFLPRAGVIDSFVVGTADNITDFCSFFTIPTTVLANGKQFKSAYCYYNAATSVSLVELMWNALVLIQSKFDIDIFSGMDIMDNLEFFQPLGFFPIDTSLYYYVYNWRCPKVESNEIGLSMM